jgi:hypothetical protein
MHAVIRSYSGSGGKELIDLIEGRKAEIESLIRGVDGFVSYSIIRTGDGGATVTVCRDKAGTDQSTQVARDWVRDNASSLGVAAPAVTEGPVSLHFG